MKLTDFKLIKNRNGIPAMYAYEKYNSSKTEKYLIATLDGGASFYVSVHSDNSKGVCVDNKMSKKHLSIDDAVSSINSFVKG